MGNSKRREKHSVTPVVATGGAYSAGDNIGGKLTFQGGGKAAQYKIASIRGIYIIDVIAQDAAIDVVIFDEDPAATTFTDQAPLNIATVDIPKIIHIENLDFYDALGSSSIVGRVSIDVSVAPSDRLYVALISRGTPTYTSVSDLTVTLITEEL